jgi:hypothetical protein
MENRVWSRPIVRYDLYMSATTQTDAWPPEIRVEDAWPASVRYILPRRSGKTALWLGRLLLAVGVFLFAMGMLAVLSAARVLPFRLPGPFFVLILCSVFTLGGTIPMWWGLAALFGHREIEIARGYLRTTERVGPLWRSKRWKLAKIESIDTVATIGESSQPTPPFLEGFEALLVRLNGKKQGMLAWGYPRQLLAPLGMAIVQRSNAWLDREGQAWNIRFVAPSQTPAAEPGDHWNDVDEDGAPGEPKPAIANLQQPADSKIQIERYPGAVSINIPPSGVWKGTRGMFFFALLWNGFMTVFTCFATFGFLHAAPGDIDNVWIPVAFVVVFWGVGIGMFLGSVNMGRRRAALAVADGTLMVLQTGIFGSKQREWPAAEIANILPGPSGMTVNDVDVLELQIHDTAGKKFGILAGRSDDELAWLAYELRQALGIKHE